MARKRNKKGAQQSRRRREARRARRRQEEGRSHQRRSASSGHGELGPLEWDEGDPFGHDWEGPMGWDLEVDPFALGEACHCSCCGGLPSLRSFEPPRLERCGAPLRLDAQGRRIPDPLDVLGLEAPGPFEYPDAGSVREAYLRELREHPPERDPERARQIREARDRLCDPERVIERELGVLHPPAPAAWGLRECVVASGSGSDLLAADERLIGQLLLYTLVEDLLSGPVRSKSAQQELF